MAFATVTDLQARIPYKLSKEQQELASVLLEDASTALIMEFGRCHKELPKGDVGAEALKMVSCNMVKRVLSSAENSDMIGADIESWRTDVGPLSETFQFANPDGSTFLRKAERDLLGLHEESRVGCISFVRERQC